MAVGPLQTRWHSAPRSCWNHSSAHAVAEGGTASPGRDSSSGCTPRRGAALTSMQPGEQWAREENLALSIALMPPQTVITDVLPYSQNPSLLLCNLLPLQGIKNVSSSASVSWLVCLSVLWEQMLRAANV